MSRHSKWSKVKQFKGAIDAKRSASFTKLAREITVAAREKGGDPAMNARLRTAIDRARGASMPKDAIDRAIARGTGEGKEGAIESLTYEAYAPGGTALIIESLTDNRNRAANEVKKLLADYGATLAASGSVTYLFDHLGVVRAASAAPLSEEAELALIEAGATDIAREDGAVEVHGAPNDLAKIAGKMRELGFTVETEEFQWIPKTLVETDEATGTQVAELIDELDAHDDVSRVFSNLA